MEESDVLTFADYRLDVSSRQLMRQQVVVPLTPRVFDVLVALVRNSERVVSRDELLQTVWSDAVVHEHNLKQTVSVLRKALGDSPGEARYIATVPGKGYKFVAAVRSIPDTPLVISRVGLSKRWKSRASAAAAVLAAALFFGTTHSSPAADAPREPASRAIQPDECGCDHRDSAHRHRQGHRTR